MSAVVTCYSLERGMLIKNGRQRGVELINVGISHVCRGGVERRGLDVITKGGNIDGAIVSNSLGDSRGPKLNRYRKNGRDCHVIRDTQIYGRNRPDELR